MCEVSTAARAQSWDQIAGLQNSQGEGQGWRTDLFISLAQPPLPGWLGCRSRLPLAGLHSLSAPTLACALGLLKVVVETSTHEQNSPED